MPLPMLEYMRKNERKKRLPPHAEKPSDSGLFDADFTKADFKRAVQDWKRKNHLL